MINNLKEDYCSFEISKLVKEKGFDIRTLCYYFEDGEFKENGLTGTNGYYGEEYSFSSNEFLENWNDKFLTKKNGDRCFGCSKDKGYFETYSAPTQDIVIKWLKKNNVYISIITGNNAKEFIFFAQIAYIKDDVYRVYTLEEESIKVLKSLGLMTHKIFNTFEEAETAAILYTLQNLIP